MTACRAGPHRLQGVAGRVGLEQGTRAFVVTTDRVPRVHTPPAESAHAVPGPPGGLLVPPRPRPRPHAQRPRPGARAPAPAPAAAPLRAPGPAAAAFALGEGRPGQPGGQAGRPLTGLLGL